LDSWHPQSAAKGLGPSQKALTGTARLCQDDGPFADIMKMLAAQIERELETETATIAHCAIYEDQLQRIWPLDEENRKRKIEQFAKEHGFRLSFYKLGLCAIFEKESQRNLERNASRSFNHSLKSPTWSCVSITLPAAA
jgi:hypothetical protein